MATAANKKPGVIKKDGTLKEKGILIQNINIRPVQRQQLDIEKWRTYHQQAEMINGSRVTLYDLYNDVLLDGFLKRLVAKRILAVTKNKLKYIDKSNKEVDGTAEILNTSTFRKLRKRIQLHKAWGIAVIEINSVDGTLCIFDVPKKHIDPQSGKILTEQYGVDGIDYRQPPYASRVIELGDYDDLGYLLEACAYVIYKRGDIADWANYAQIFGMPFREARYDGYNEQVRIQLENALEKAGSAAYAVLPKEAELTFHEAKGVTGSTDLYDRLRTAMNQELTVHILGATETTTSSQSSGYAQSQTHQQTVEEVAQDDKEDELAILNEQVLPVMVYLGLLPDGGSFAYDEPMDLASAKEKVSIAQQAKLMGVPISDDYIYEITGIPKPDNYDELKQKQADEKAIEQAAAPGNEDDKKPVGKKKPGDKKLSLEDEIKKVLNDFFGNALNG